MNSHLIQSTLLLQGSQLPIAGLSASQEDLFFQPEGWVVGHLLSYKIKGNCYVRPWVGDHYSLQADHGSRRLLVRSAGHGSCIRWSGSHCHVKERWAGNELCCHFCSNDSLDRSPDTLSIVSDLWPNYQGGLEKVVMLVYLLWLCLTK